MENVALESKFRVIFYFSVVNARNTCTDSYKFESSIKYILERCMAERGNSFEAKMYVACHLE